MKNAHHSAIVSRAFPPAHSARRRIHGEQAHEERAPQRDRVARLSARSFRPPPQRTIEMPFPRLDFRSPEYDHSFTQRANDRIRTRQENLARTGDTG
ncbi:hypothetical protein [Burkholderia cepacia]|uniref:hypothetical protein n=1 Tax=Burkholderia cepacia TaxID=292 RepID=UPI002AB6174F|nr:hypothetical protein [Burkholderia cepacia]